MLVRDAPVDQHQRGVRVGDVVPVPNGKFSSGVRAAVRWLFLRSIKPRKCSGLFATTRNVGSVTVIVSKHSGKSLGKN